MTFKKFYLDLSKEEKEELAVTADTSKAYLDQIASGHRNAGFSTVKKLIRADSRISIEMFDPELAA